MVMGNDEDLIRRLRDFADGKSNEDPKELCRQAADALEESGLAMQSLAEGAKRVMQIYAERKKS